MNITKILPLIRDIRALIDQANALATPDGGPPRWSLAYTNRSFILATTALLVQVAAVLGLPFPIPAEVAGETAWALVSLAALAWAGVERLRGVTRAVWSRRQAKDALQEADALTEALERAGVTHARKTPDAGR